MPLLDLSHGVTSSTLVQGGVGFVAVSMAGTPLQGKGVVTSGGMRSPRLPAPVSHSHATHTQVLAPPVHPHQNFGAADEVQPLTSICWCCCCLKSTSLCCCLKPDLRSQFVWHNSWRCMVAIAPQAQHFAADNFHHPTSACQDYAQVAACTGMSWALFILLYTFLLLTAAATHAGFA